jgi:hypothetical protein
MLYRRKPAPAKPSGNPLDVPESFPGNGPIAWGGCRSQKKLSAKYVKHPSHSQKHPDAVLPANPDYVGKSVYSTGSVEYVRSG